MKILFSDWLNRIDENFEKEFWIDESNSSQYVNRKLIYKDTVNSTLQWPDFELRPNFLVAAVVVSLVFFTFFIYQIISFKGSGNV
jgi:glycogen debranching enzyme